MGSNITEWCSNEQIPEKGRFCGCRRLESDVLHPGEMMADLDVYIYLGDSFEPITLRLTVN
jgi:hypothetical protein